MYVHVLDIELLMKAHGSFFFLFILQLGREVLDIAANATEVGITTEEIDRIVHEVNVFQ